MKYVFYITSHGYGHASRNVPIINEIINRDKNAQVIIKSDAERCDFLSRNLKRRAKRIAYYSDCSEVGVLTKVGKPIIDPKATLAAIENDYLNWDSYVSREVTFLKQEKPDVVVCDIISWGIKAARMAEVPSLLIGNFTWSSVYSSLFEKDAYARYAENYRLADKAIWYEIHSKEVEKIVDDWIAVSLISRKTNSAEVERIKANHSRRIVFFSVGASVDIEKVYDVSGLPYDFITTRGINLYGDNVIETPPDMINTPDYIAASDYVIVKGGWSSVAEALLQKKKCALLFRGENSEDDETKHYLESRGQCVAVQYKDLDDIGSIIDRIEKLKPKEYTYYDSTDEVCTVIIDLAKSRKN